MTFLKTALALLKKYWKVLAVILAATVGFFLLRKRDLSFVDELRKVQASHDEEVRQINAVREEERKQHAENLRRRDEALAVVQRQYDESMTQLDSKKKKEIEQIVKEHGKDPVALAQKLSEATGFTIVMPD